MNTYERMMMCQHCRDKSSAIMGVDDANRINSSIRDLLFYIRHKGYMLDMVANNARSPIFDKRNTRDLCTSHFHIMCGTCPEINNLQRKVNGVNEVLSKQVAKLHLFLIDIKDSDKQTYGYIKSNLSRSLGGHYTKAAQLINRS